MKLKAPIIAAFLMVSALVCSGQLYAATYHVDNANGNDNGSCGVAASPCQTINYAGSQMSSGDTMLIKSGTYNEGIDNSTIPKGSSSAYTTMEGEKYSRVVITGDVSISGNKNHYMQFKNLKFTSDDLKNFSGHYIKVIKTIFQNGPPEDAYKTLVSIGTNDHSNSHILFEDVLAFGIGGRYKIQFYRVDKSICRRCIVRSDGGWRVGNKNGIGNPEGGLMVYECNDFEVQNPIVIDSIYRSREEKLGNLMFNSHKTVANNTARGGIIFNNEAGGLSFEGHGNIQNAYVEDTVLIENEYGGVANMGGGLSLQMENMAIIDNSDDGYAHFGKGSMSISDSIVYGNENEGTRDVSTSNISTSDPSVKGYIYLPRTEAGSNLYNAGVGPNIKRIGKDGTLYGETGYKDVQTKSLFPLTNNTEITSELCDPATLANNGRTGSNTPALCSSGKDLTRYIWEKLGAACPGAVCESPPEPPGNITYTILQSTSS